MNQTKENILIDTYEKENIVQEIKELNKTGYIRFYFI